MVAAGISSFKIFMAYPNVLMVNDRIDLQIDGTNKTSSARLCVSMPRMAP